MLRYIILPVALLLALAIPTLASADPWWSGPWGGTPAAWNSIYFTAANGVTGFFGDGTIIGVNNSITGRTLIGIHNGSWQAVGYLGEIPLPPNLTINFVDHPGSDEMVAVRINSIGGGDGGVVAAPELAILRRLSLRSLGIGVGRYIGPLVTPTLQQVTTRGAAGLLRALGIKATIRNQTFIEMPRATLWIQEWCSGFATIRWYVLLAFLLACLVPGWRWKIALIVLAPIVAIEANILRVASLGASIETFYVDAWAIKEPLGLMTTALGMAQLLALGLVVSRLSRR